MEYGERFSQSIVQDIRFRDLFWDNRIAPTHHRVDSRAFTLAPQFSSAIKWLCQCSVALNHVVGVPPGQVAALQGRTME